MDDRIQEALRTIDRRRALLDRLRSPADKRELVEHLDCSRATVDRAIRRLESLGWIERVDDGWQVSLTGRTVLDRYARFREEFADVLAGTEALASLPPDADVDARLFEGATVIPEDRREVGSGDGTQGSGDGAGNELPAELRARIESADRIRLIAPGETAATLLSSCRELSSGTVEAVLDRRVLSRLPERTPALARWLVESDRAAAFAAETPPYALLLLSEGDATVVSVVGHREDRSVEGVVSNDDDDAVEWGERQYRALRRIATPLAEAVEWGGVPVPTDPDPTDTLFREGFLKLTPSYFAEREPLPLPTAWRAGVGFPEVAAGHALEREHVRDGERRSLVADLLSALEGGGTRALIGPPGSGKSTVCRGVAYRWYRSVGSVLYRPEGGPEPFESWEALVRLLRDRTRPTLVVIEGALRADARAAFRAIEALEDDAGVAFLLESGSERWAVGGTFDVDPHDEAIRERIGTVRMPALDATERERFRSRLEDATGVSVDVDTDGSTEAEGGEAAEPGELLLFLNRLVMQVDTAGRDGSDVGTEGEPAVGSETASGLDADVEELCASLRGDELAMDTAVLVNLLNAAELPVLPEYAYALAFEAGDGIVAPSADAGETTGQSTEDRLEDRLRRVEQAIEELSGRVLFDSQNRGRYRTIHAGWSSAFLRRLLETDGRAAIDRADRCVSTLLALAVDEASRERLRDLRDGGRLSSASDGKDPLDRIAERPGDWAESISRRLIEFSEDHPALAPLLCGCGGPTFTVPRATSAGLPVELAERCGRGHLAGGRLEEATMAFESALDRLENAPLATEDRIRLRARCRVGLGNVADEQGTYDEAERLYREALSDYRELDDSLGIADSLRHLGSVAQRRSELDVAADRYARSLAIYREIGAERKLATALSDIGSVAQDRGDFETAGRHYRESQRRYSALGERREIVDVLGKLATVGWVTGDLEGAEKRARRAAAIAREIGYEHGFATAQYHLAVVSNVRGDTAAARRHAERAADAFAAIGNNHHEASTRSLLGEVERASGNLDRAEEHYRMAARRHEDVDDDRGHLDALLGLGRIARQRGDLDGATERAERALKLARSVGDARSEAACLRLLGTIDRERGDLDRADERLEEARSGYRDVEERHGEAATLLELAEVAADRDERDRARELFGRAIEGYREIDATPDAADALERFADRCETWGAVDEARRRRSTAERLREGNSDSENPLAE
ncbi:TPR repeat-containing protein [Halalkaliarchaeum desulfuricum]|uniref:TPR repeat-containing protein n=1 Tax=Halalkaliarchaeum desulfuricum TaxID=2055893 RepID=A0A343TNE6_9EURY|nr:tetratricopeptide repeat protein [Halalkaliarchaeum desulfuricum]AUX10618.1 TPR repeat-containing protein [Halalkaliarchaeum desulfuricum]